MPNCSKTCTKRTTWCQLIPEYHDEDICHNVSLKQRDILNKVRKLIEDNYNQPICEEWDTSPTLNNTKGPYRFGKIDPSKRHQEVIGGELISRCDCGKRNGLQDDCQRWNCRGRPECKTWRFPKCGPFLGFPSDKTVPAYNASTKAPNTFDGKTEICGSCNCAIDI